MTASENTQTAPRVKIRIEALSDLVFGLALSIGSLQLLAKTPQSTAELEQSVALFAFSFFIVVSIWFGYSRVMLVTAQETSGAVGLNLLLLFFVVLEPYLFFVLQSRPNTGAAGLDFLDATSIGYALDVGAMFLILAGLVWLVLREKAPKNPDLHPALIRRLKVGMLFYAAVGIIYIISALPIFWVNVQPIGYPRFYLWYSAFAFAFFGVVNRRREKGKQRKASS